MNHRIHSFYYQAVILLLLILSFLNSYGQLLEFFGGPNTNRFYDLQKNQGHFDAKYTPGLGYSIGLGIQDIKLDQLSIQCFFKFDHYTGDIDIRTGGMAGSISLKAGISKDVIGFDIYPLNFVVRKNLRLSLGGEFNYLLQGKVAGYRNSWMITGAGNYVNLDNDSIHLSKNSNWGLIGCISYDLEILKDWFIVPQYSFYLGVTEEFRDFEAMTKSYRHYLWVGIVRKIK
jgi:hypothetical protein